jgi:hypothetical protein
MGSPKKRKAPKPYKKARRIKAFSGRTSSIRIDLRTAEGRYYLATRDALIEHIESNHSEATVPQRMIAEATALLWVRFALLSEKMLDPEFGSGSYEQFLAFNSSIRQNLKEIGITRQNVERVLPSPLEILDKRAVNE